MTDSRTNVVSDSPDAWPLLPLAEWKDTLATLHMWMQIVGKVRLALTPRANHWWNVPLYVNARGLTTSPIPYGQRIFEIHFDFVEHKLVIQMNDGITRSIPLVPRSVADFYQEFMATLRSLDLEVKIWKLPVEIPNPVVFDQDRVHSSYDPEYARRFWRILVSTDEVFKTFSTRFLGKASPVHFFWGAMDLAVTRFSGRRAPERNDPDPVLRKIMREAYSHEVISAGWWPGGNGVNDAAFYAYTAPVLDGFGKQSVRPQRAFYDSNLGEFLLMYDDVRSASSPTAALLEFLQSTYEAGATLGKWDREALERRDQAAAGAA